MIFPKAKKIAKEQDWHKTKSSVFGLYKGYFFTVGDASLWSNPQYKYITAETGKLTEGQKQHLHSELENNKKLLKYSTIEIGDSGLLIQFFEHLTSTKIKTVYTLLDFLVELFKKYDVPEQNKCHNCQAKDRLDYYNANDSGLILCNPCFQEAENQFYEIEREKFSEEKNYFTGFLGSIIFSIPAIIAWVLVAVYLETLVSAMALVIAFLGLQGYNFFKGKQGKLTNYLIVLSNILCIIMANVATIGFLLIQEGLSFNEAIQELQTNPVAQDLLYENMLLSFVLSFFVWIWLLFLLKDKNLIIKLAEKIEK